MSTRHISHLILTAAIAAAVVGCGGGGQPAATATATTTTATATATGTATPAQAHAKDAHPPPPDAATPTATATATATPTSPEDEPGGAGDEQIVRVPVELTIQPDGQLRPATVSVPGFLTLELIVHNRTGAPIAVRFEGERLVVASGATGHRRFSGLRKGRYAVRADGAGTATVVVGVEPGP